MSEIKFRVCPKDPPTAVLEAINEALAAHPGRAQAAEIALDAARKAEGYGHWAESLARWYIQERVLADAEKAVTEATAVSFPSAPGVSGETYAEAHARLRADLAEAQKRAAEVGAEKGRAWVKGATVSEMKGLIEVFSKAPVAAWVAEHNAKDQLHSPLFGGLLQLATVIPGRGKSASDYWANILGDHNVRNVPLIQAFLEAALAGCRTAV